MTLQHLIRQSRTEPEASFGDAELNWIVADSRKVQPGSLFVCMPSGNRDSHQFIGAALEAGARAVLVRDREVMDSLSARQIPAVLFPLEGRPFNEALASICDAFWQCPTANMRVIGITGTNGKTTTAWMIRDALESLGRNAAYLGTLGFSLNHSRHTLENTTPFPIELYQLLSEARDAGCEDFVMEVSSHALQEGRVAGVQFDVGVFTNLSQDHLDYHGSMEAYQAAKWELFTNYASRSKSHFKAALNEDDAVGAEWASALGPKALTYGIANGQLRGIPQQVTVDQIQLQLHLGDAYSTVVAHVGGQFNVWNLLSAAAGLTCLDYSLDQIAEALGSVTPVSGRFESVPNALGIGILVDYAHTPDAIEKLLESVRELSPKRIITVFGCGGDRDRTKRPKMAKAASERSDLCVITSDNPRTEDPALIVEEVQTGIVPGAKSVTIVDRREAIAYAVHEAKAGDVVVIAGKGHEDYQIIGRTKHHMDDREMAREALAVRA